MRVLDRLQDTPAQVITGLAETLVQTPLATALFGDETSYTGLNRSIVYRWFTSPASRRIYPADDHQRHSRIFTAELRAAYARDGAGTRAEEIVTSLLDQSTEFKDLWASHEIGIHHTELKRIQHPDIGILELHCQALFDVEQLQALLVFTAIPGTASYEKLQLLSVIGTQQLRPQQRSNPPQ